jgi:tRNA U34 5-methylaminomethyl-2-thiouridine-forming methyltransferase MnmC
MTDTDQPRADAIVWEGAVPVSPRYGDPYYSRADGLAEARHVFLAGNDLPTRFGPGFLVAELGFGTGLNVLAAWQAWNASRQPGSLRVTSFEAAPLEAGAMARAHAAFPDMAELSALLCAAWREPAVAATMRLQLPGLDLTVVVGDVSDTLAGWHGRADAWFLDGFAPARNPAMWAPAVIARVAARTAPGGTLATYSAAGHVRRALAEAGLIVARAPGYGAKRHMTRAVLA